MTSLIALCILNVESGEIDKILTFTSQDLAIQYIISEEAGYLEDPDEIEKIYQDLKDNQSIYAHDNITRGSYQLIETILVE